MVNNSVFTVRESLREIIANVGRGALHSQYPDEFEYYSIVMQLCNSYDEIVQILVFPVMPSEFSESETPMISNKKSSAGVFTLMNTSFNPTTITISGNFGRKLRLLFGNDGNYSGAFSFRGKVAANGLDFGSGNGVDSTTGESRLLGNLTNAQLEFNGRIKSGYGILKLMDKMLSFAKSKLDEYGNPYKLYFFNYALNKSYIVEPVNLIYRQNQSDSNMMWNYVLILNSTSPSDFNDNKKEIVLTNAVNNRINKNLRALTNVSKAYKANLSQIAS